MTEIADESLVEQFSSFDISDAIEDRFLERRRAQYLASQGEHSEDDADSTSSDIINRSLHVNELGNFLDNLDAGQKLRSSRFEEVERLKKELTDCKVQLRLQRDLLRDMEEENGTGGKLLENVELRRQVQTLLDDQRDIAGEIDDKTEKIKELERQVAQRDENAKQLEAEVDSLKIAVQDQHATIQDQLDDIDEKEHTLKEYCVSLDERNAIITARDLEIKDLDSAIKDRDAAITGQEVAIKSLASQEAETRKYEEMLGEKEAKIGEQKAKIGEQKAKIGEQEAKISEQEAKISSQSAKIAEQSTLLSKHSDEVNSLDSKLTELSTIKSKLTSQRAKIKALESQAIGLQSDNDELTARINAMEQAKKAKDQAMKTKEHALAQQRQRVEALEEETALLKRDNVRLSKAIEDIQDDRDSELAQLEEEHRAAVAELQLQQNDDELVMELFNSDVRFQTHAIKLLSKLLDKKSIREAGEKVVQVADRKDLGLQDESAAMLVEAVDDYILQGMDTVIESYLSRKEEFSTVPLKDSTNIVNSVSTINSENGADPRTKLRVNELTKRWKAAEEALSFERAQSKKRLDDLEAENERLRVQLA